MNEPLFMMAVFYLIKGEFHRRVAGEAAGKAASKRTSELFNFMDHY
jgi:hypothetical protein